MNKDQSYFTSLDSNKVGSSIKALTKVLISFFTIFILLMTFTPWQQTSHGTGTVIAFDPNDRVQDIQSPIQGRINEWFVQDGSVVRKGDPIVEIIDNDPNFIDRLTIERDATLKSYRAAKIASETSVLNYKRQKDLYEKGLTSRAEYEKSLIAYKKLLAEEAKMAAELAKSEVRLSRQENQLITAPRDGTILRVVHGSGSIFVSEGAVLASFVPTTLDTAVELYINGNDLPLVYPGRHVRLQFEGWPAVQFSGWPSVAIGTFGGIVSVVDPSATYKGKFRIIVRPEKNGDWPDIQYLRQGTRVYGWVLLNTVKLGYELWRQFNGFPPSLDSPPDLIEKNTSQKKRKKNDKEKN